MENAEKEAIRRVLSNVGVANKYAPLPQFIFNMNQFFWWLKSKLTTPQKIHRFLDLLECSRVELDVYLFSYAVENPQFFAEKLIECLEE